MNDIALNLERLRARIASTAVNCGRNPEAIELLAVSKTFPPEAIEAGVAAGQLQFGENRVQEAAAKIPAVQARGIGWHLIGHLQSNKVRRAVELFDVIQTLDSPKIVRKVGRTADSLGKKLPVFVQVNVGREAQKYGVLPQDTRSVVNLVDSFRQLQLLGLMTMPPFSRDPEQVRPYLVQLRRLLQEINQGRKQPLGQLSMGMSNDYRIAIEEGSTLLRIGTAVFGVRG